MKKFSFLALFAMVLCLVSCGPKETTTPLDGTSDYVLFSMSDAPNKYGVKNAQGQVIIPNVYENVLYAEDYFAVQDESGYKLLSAENETIFQSSADIVYNGTANWFESKEKSKISLFIPKEAGYISGNFESYGIDNIGNFQVKENGKYGVYTLAGQLIIPITNEMLLIDGDNYIALNSKNLKLPMLKDGKITSWSRVKITAYDKGGKATKAPSSYQVRKLVK